MQLRYTPYEITAQNHKEFLIPNNELHNFIVSLYALTDVMVEATHAYLNHIHDPLQRLIELLLRYSIYRNYVLAIEVSYLLLRSTCRSPSKSTTTCIVKPLKMTRRSPDTASGGLRSRSGT